VKVFGKGEGENKWTIKLLKRIKGMALRGRKKSRKLIFEILLQLQLYKMRKK